jgi:uncharacterized protein (DUF1330 family)
MQTIEPSHEQLQAFAGQPDDGEPIVMLNLLRYRQRADYAQHPQQTPCSGRDAFKRYAKSSLVCIEAAGGKVLFIGAAQPAVIGPEAEQWDEIFLVHYPSRRAFLDMIASAEYRAIAFHRSAALQDSRLIPARAKMFAPS